LRDRYQVQFELRMSATTSANNYEYLDILDRGWSESGIGRRWGYLAHYLLVSVSDSARPIGAAPAADAPGAWEAISADST
jgi:hypothetical protein